MLASVATTNFWSYIFAGVVAAIVIGIGTSVVHLLRNRSGSIKDDADDMKTLTLWLFGRKRTPRTGAPPEKGWTTKVDERLAEHSDQLSQISASNTKILTEIEGLRGEARKEVQAQTAERQRVHEREMP